MTKDLWAEVDAYFEDALLGPDEVLEAAARTNAEEGLPHIDVSPSLGRFLQLLARLQGARRILEIGTLGGYSAIWLARALPPEGRLITIEIDPKHAEVARANTARAGLENIVEVRVGAALDELARLEQEGSDPFDLVFIDADKVNSAPYFEWAIRLSRPGTVIVVDNVVREGEVLEPNSDDPNVQGIRRLAELLENEPRVSAAAIQTVGRKGYDGFAIARVNGANGDP